MSNQRNANESSTKQLPIKKLHHHLQDMQELLNTPHILRVLLCNTYVRTSLGTKVLLENSIDLWFFAYGITGNSLRSLYRLIFQVPIGS